VFIIAALLALVGTPVVMTWRLDALHANGATTTGRAHLLTDSLKTLFVDEIILLEQIRRGDSHSGVHYRGVRASQDRMIAGLREVAPRISTITTDHVNTVATLSERWHTVPDAFAAGRISEKLATGEMLRILADRDAMLAAEQRLDADIESVTASQREQGENVLRVQRWLSLGLGVLALLATMVVAWFAQRERRLTSALVRSIAISQQRRADLETITESRNRLMRGFSHDVKNPIGAADGYMQLLEDEILGPVTVKQRTGIERARRSLQAALHLINDLLEIAKTEEGHISITLVTTDVRTVAEEAGEQYRAQAEAKGLTMHVDTSVAIPTILSDPIRVRQVLGNLISNAVKYTARGDVAVRVGHEHDPEGCGRISISVADTGIGIDEDQQRLVFQEFVRLDPTAESGVGVGLAISSRIVEALGGSITVKSKKGDGSVFVLWLPTE
jgi:signal transduction histidine kinase